MTLRRVTREECTITLMPLDEDFDFRKEYDPEVVAGIAENVEYNGIWGWCCIRVEATWAIPGHPNYKYKGTAHLGGCSYRSEEDFVNGDSDYYDDLVEEAVNAVNENLLGTITRADLLRAFLESTDPA